MSENLNDSPFAYGRHRTSNLMAKQSMRQSFDRFDDSLVENILSFLTFNEKVLFESVSKRWKQFVYNQQKELQLNRWGIDGKSSLIKILEPLEVVDFVTGLAADNNLKAVNKNRLKSVLKKCNSIEKVILDCFLDFEVLDIIGGLSPKLKCLEFDTTGLTADDLDRFGQRYGHQIEKLRFLYVWPYIPRYYSRKFLRHCKKLQHFVYPRCSELMSEDNDFLPEIQTVDDFWLSQLSDEESDDCKRVAQFDIFCNKYRQKMKKIQITAYSGFNKKQLESFFTSVCRFNNLTELELDFDTSDQTRQSINQHLALISHQNPCLKSFKLSLYTDAIIMDRLFYSFDGFVNLIRLKIAVIYYNQIKQIKGNVKCFQSLQKLKTFDINYKHISEEFFDDIDKHLPNLSTLRIECESEISDKTIFQLSRLKKLKTFYFNKYQNSCQQITDDSICAMIRGCPALEVMYFASRPKFTNRTIETLINCLTNEPKRRLTFHCRVSYLADENHFQTIDLNSFETIPQNLTINVELN